MITSSSLAPTKRSICTLRTCQEDKYKEQIYAFLAGIEFIENQRVSLTTRGTTANQVNVYHSAPSMSQVIFNQYHHNHKDIKL